MNDNYTTERLSISPLTQNDAAFIMELVNTPGWLQFIGERNVGSLEESNQYIQKILTNPDVNYWVVKISANQTSIGVVTLIKRDYLAHHDIGFAFLPNYAKNGYAYEAALAILNEVIKDPLHTHILATTLKDNINSIQLLKKLGLQFVEQIENENALLLVYGVAADTHLKVL